MTAPRLRFDLRSDTKTRPTPAMREAMARAEVGDEQAGEDPSVNALCERAAALLGHEAALFLPSGTMCNQIAILVHCAAGDEILAHAASHIIGSEGAGAAALAGVQILPLPGPRGIFSAADLDAAIRAPKRNAPRSRLVSVEQTVNRTGGSVWPVASLVDVVAVARRHGLATHMDGARLMNAAIAAGVNARDFAGLVDTAWLDLSKGLGCPVGGVLAGSRDFVEAAWRWKHRLGGAMRQAGIVAAAGLHALDHHVARLAEDHANAKRLAARIAALPGVRLDPPEVETNLVFFDVAASGWAAAALSAALAARGVGIGADGRTRLRAVTHLDVDAAGVDAAAAALAELIAAGPQAAAGA